MDTLQKYIDNKCDIPKKFVQRFVQNYDNNGVWIQSEQAYDTWFNKYYSQFKKFIQGVKRELIEDIDYKLQRAQAGPVKDEYLITYNGLKQLEMKCDKSTRIYYVKLENLLHEYIKYEKEQQQQKIKELETKYEESKKIGLIYKYKHKRYNSIDYIGLHHGEQPYSRHASHKSNAQQGLKLPFYRAAFLQGFSNYEIQVVEDVSYHNDDELMQREKYWQTHLNSIYNKDTLVCAKCGQSYKQIQSFEDHRQKCYNITD